jgi:hypothetical protein
LLQLGGGCRLAVADNFHEIQLVLILRSRAGVILGECADNGGAALVNSGFAGRTARQGDKNLVVVRRTVGLLNARIPETGLVHGGTNAVGIGFLGEFDTDNGAPAEVNVEGQAVPEEDGQEAGNTEDEGKAEEIPLLPEPVYFGVMKQFHENPPIEKSLEVAMLRSKSVRRAICGSGWRRR